MSLRRIYGAPDRCEWRLYAPPPDSDDLFKPTSREPVMGQFLLWCLIAGIGVYLLVAMLRPDKF